MSFSDNIEQFEHEIDSPDFERHDKYNFEVSLDIFPTTKKKDIFMLEMYGFLPKSLQINEQTYSSSNFYNDLNLYTRYKTPKISLKALLNPKITVSPLNRISLWIEDPEIQPSKMLYEIRMFGAIVRVDIRNQLEVYGSILKSKLDFDEKHYTDFLSQVIDLQKRIHELSHKIYHSVLSQGLKNAFNYVSQFVFIQMELRLSKFLEKHGSKLPIILRNKSIEIIEKVREERTHFNPNIELDFTKTGEKFEYSEGLLKKFSQHVLYLQQVRQKREKQWKQLMYSIAAGIAMVISALLTILIVSKFPQNSIPFVLAIVVIYMFKDRIKWLVQWLSKRTIRIFIADRTHKIYDPLEKTYIGVMRETMRFLYEEEEVPEIIRNLRNKNRSEIEHQENLETFFKYKKILQLKSDVINKIHNRVQNVHDIFRFNIKNFIQYADDPFKEYPIISSSDPEGAQKVRQYKVYHINLIFKISRLKSKKHEESFFKQVRIVLDQNGIKRMEEL